MLERDAHALLAAVHEAGHAVIAAACGLPLVHAIVREKRAEVSLDRPKAALLAARHKRCHPAPAPRAAHVGAQLALIAWAAAGESAVELRVTDRPRALWQPHAHAVRGASPGDRRIIYRAQERLREIGVNGGAATSDILDWTDATLGRHSRIVACVALALLRQRRLTGVELDRLLAPVAADPAPVRLLLAMAERIAKDPALAWPPPSSFRSVIGS